MQKRVGAQEIRDATAVHLELDGRGLPVDAIGGASVGAGASAGSQARPGDGSDAADRKGAARLLAARLRTMGAGVARSLTPNSECADPAPFAAATAYDSAADVPAFDQLRGAVRADVCIIGGGFTGVSAAIHLAERGADVVVVEAGLMGSGPSARNGGQVIGGTSLDAGVARHAGPDGAALLKHIFYRGHDIIAERCARYGIDCEWTPGWVLAARKANHLRHLHDEVERHDAMGFSDAVTPLDAAATAERLGTQTYVSSVLNTRAGHIQPRKLLAGEIRAAQALGVRFFERSPVVEVDDAGPAVRAQRCTLRERGHVGAVRVAGRHGAVVCDLAVLAAGANHKLMPHRLGGLTQPVGSYIIATEPLNDALGDRGRRVLPHTDAVCGTDTVHDYYRRSQDGRMLFGGRVGFSLTRPGDIAKLLRPRMERLFPQLRGIGLTHRWGGLVGVNLNVMPAIGRASPHVVFAQGFAGHGVNMSHIAGEMLADAVLASSDVFDDLSEVRHWRSPAPTWMTGHAMALAIQYHRIKDALN